MSFFCADARKHYPLSAAGLNSSIDGKDLLGQLQVAVITRWQAGAQREFIGNGLMRLHFPRINSHTSGFLWGMMLLVVNSSGMK